MKRLATQLTIVIILCLNIVSCMEYGPMDEEEFDFSQRGLFITNEGNFMYGNASLSYYIPDEKKIENEIFIRSNGINLGDVAQSMVIRNGTGYIVVNNSGIIFAIDIKTFKVIGSVKGLTSPRYIHFLSDTKAYVTDLYDPRITIFNPQTYEITGRIDMHGHKSTEQMVQYDKYIFTNCWSYDNKILIVDTEKDLLVDSIQVGIQPTSLVIDKNNKIWTITDGGYEGSPYGWTTPSMYRIDAASRKIETEFTFAKGDWPSEVQLNGARDTVYWINKSIWKMNVESNRVPLRPFIKDRNTLFYGLTVDPVTSEVYIADAIDYVQPGVVYRFSAGAEPVDTFRVGIIPGVFCFK